MASQNYMPQHFNSEVKRQAITVWAAAAAIVLAWLLVIIGAPVLKANGLGGASQIYHFFSYACHQLPDRSFFIEGQQCAVCSRCFGVYFGLFVGIVAYPVWRTLHETEPVPRIWLFLSLIPIGIDWGLGVLGIWANTHVSRFLTGVLLGAACATFILPALVEIARNLKLGRAPRTRPADN